MPITENLDIPRIRADLARCEQRIAQMEGGTAGQIPAGFAHVNASQAMYAQLTARRADQLRLQKDLINAMIGSGKWLGSEVIERMEAEPVSHTNDLTQRHIYGHLSAARRHLERHDDAKAEEHLIAATQLVRSRQPKETI